MSGVDAAVLLKFAAILAGLVWLSRRASRAASADRREDRKDGGGSA